MYAIQVLYEGRPIASLEEAEAAILHCDGKRMITNVRAFCQQSGLITYGERQTIVQEGECAILWCRNKRALHDIIIHVDGITEFESNFYVKTDEEGDEYEYVVDKDGYIFLVNYVE